MPRPVSSSPSFPAVPHPADGSRIVAVLDTDIGYLNDDSVALAVLLGSSEVDLRGVAAVAGNFDHDQEVLDGLAMLERLGRADVPLWRGADRPLVHERGAYHAGGWGGFATYVEAVRPAGLSSHAAPSAVFAARAFSDLAREHPGELTIFAVGPLTNVAAALAADPDLAGLLRGIVVMGGAIAGLPHGAGNVTPTAEFNFFVDPEAAAIVLRCGAPVLLVPLNACRPVTYTEDFHRALLERGGPGAEMLDERMRGVFDRGTDDGDTANFSHYGLTDSTAVVAGLDPTSVTVERLTVQIDLSHGPAYGTSYAYRPGDLTAAKIADAPGVYEAMVQPAPLMGAVSGPVEVDAVTAVDPDRVRRQILERLSALAG